MNLHLILTSEPRVKRNADDRAKVAEMQGNLARRRERIAREQQEVRQRYEADYRQAIAEDREPPPPPEPPPEPPLAMELASTMNRLDEERVRLLRELAPRVDREARRREAELLGKVGDLKVSDLGPVVAEVNSLAFTVHHCMSIGPPITDKDPALEPPSSPQHRCYDEQESFSPGELVDAVIRGQSLLHVPAARMLGKVVVGLDQSEEDLYPREEESPYAPETQRLMRQARARERGIRVMRPAGEIRNLVRGVPPPPNQAQGA